MQNKGAAELAKIDFFPVLRFSSKFLFVDRVMRFSFVFHQYILFALISRKIWKSEKNCSNCLYVLVGNYWLLQKNI